MDGEMRMKNASVKIWNRNDEKRQKVFLLDLDILAWRFWRNNSLFSNMSGKFIALLQLLLYRYCLTFTVQLYLTHNNWWTFSFSLRKGAPPFLLAFTTTTSRAKIFFSSAQRFLSFSVYSLARALFSTGLPGSKK